MVHDFMPDLSPPDVRLTNRKCCCEYCYREVRPGNTKTQTSNMRKHQKNSFLSDYDPLLSENGERNRANKKASNSNAYQLTNGGNSQILLAVNN